MQANGFGNFNLHRMADQHARAAGPEANRQVQLMVAAQTGTIKREDIPKIQANDQAQALYRIQQQNQIRNQNLAYMMNFMQGLQQLYAGFSMFGGGATGYGGYPGMYY